jgi:hypothetical protein
MKSLWIPALFVGAFVAMSMNCGPKHPYCPDEHDMECRPPELDGSMTNMGGAGGMDRGPCDGGAISVGPDGAITCL